MLPPTTAVPAVVEIRPSVRRWTGSNLQAGARMRVGTLTYDGTTYRLEGPAIDELIARGVIRADPMFGDQFDLAPDHLIAEVEPFAGFTSFLGGDDARGESASGDEDRGHFAVRLHQRNGFGGFR